MTTDPDIPEDVYRIIDHFSGLAEKEINSKKDQLPPVLLMFEQNGEDSISLKEVLPVASFMQSASGKQLLMTVIESAFKGSENLKVMLLISEAWTVQVPADKFTLQEVNRLRPSEHPDRKEVLLFNFMLRNNRQMILQKAIQRDPETQHVLLGATEFVSANTGRDHMQGPLVFDSDERDNEQPRPSALH